MIRQVISTMLSRFSTPYVCQKCHVSLDDLDQRTSAGVKSARPQKSKRTTEAELKTRKSMATLPFWIERGDQSEAPIKIKERPNKGLTGEDYELWSGKKSIIVVFANTSRKVYSYELIMQMDVRDDIHEAIFYGRPASLNENAKFIFAFDKKDPAYVLTDLDQYAEWQASRAVALHISWYEKNNINFPRVLTVEELALVTV